MRNPFSWHTIAIIMTAIVVIFIPPAVEPGAAPINIKIMVVIFDISCILDNGTQLNPAVLVATE